MFPDTRYKTSLALPDPTSQSRLTMPPAKDKTSNDDPKTEVTNPPKDKNGSGANEHRSNGKMRRVASSANSNLREVTNVGAPNSSTAPTAAVAQEIPVPGVCLGSLTGDTCIPYRVLTGISTSYDGLHLTATSCTSTDGNTSSILRPPLRMVTIIGCSQDPA